MESPDQNTVKRELKVGDWIMIGNLKCVVTRLYNEQQPGVYGGLGEVIYQVGREQYVARDFDLNGSEYGFPKRPDFGGHASGSFYSSFKVQLTRGHP